MRGGRSYKLEVLEINDIIEVEDVEELRVRKLLSSLRSSKLLMKPLIVEESKNFIIDGHHRFKALKILGVRRIPVLLAKYGVDVEDVGGWIYVVDSNVKLDLNYLLKIVDDLEYLTKRGSDSLVINVFEDRLKVSVDRIDLYIALKYVTIPLTKVPQRSEALNLSLILPKLLPEDLRLLVSKGLTLPPRMTYHKTYLKDVIIPYPISKLLRC